MAGGRTNASLEGGNLSPAGDSSGNIILYDKAGNIIFTGDGTNRKVTFPASSTLDVSAATLTLGAGQVTAAFLGASLKTGFIDLPLHTWRIANAGANDYGLLAATAAIGSGGVGGADASPSLIRVNTSTDKTARLVYADAVVKPILNDFTLPPDVDASAALTFKVLAAMSGTNDATSILTLTWVAVAAGAYAAGADQGSASTAFAAVTTLVQKSFTVAAAAINAPGSHVSVSLVPTSPGTDAMHIYGAWCEYTRKT